MQKQLQLLLPLCRCQTVVVSVAVQLKPINRCLELMTPGSRQWCQVAVPTAAAHQANMSWALPAWRANSNSSSRNCGRLKLLPGLTALWWQVVQQVLLLLLLQQQPCHNRRHIQGVFLALIVLMEGLFMMQGAAQASHRRLLNLHSRLSSSSQAGQQLQLMCHNPQSQACS